MKPENIRRISQIVEPVLETMGAFLVDLRVQREHGTDVVQVFADTDKGITVDQCADVTRQVTTEISMLDFLPGRYRLEVSSPGLEHPLKLQRQFKKSVGRQLRIVSRGDAGDVTVTGTLRSVSETDLNLSTLDAQTKIFALRDVVEAYVLPQLSKGKAG